MKNTINNMKNNEIWKEIPGYEGLYEVSNQGRVKSFNYRRSCKVKILKLSLNRGYYKTTLMKNGGSKTFGNQQLVAMAFKNHFPQGNSLVVDHINSNKLDNRLENLRVITHRENTSKEVTSKSKLPTGVNKQNGKFRSKIKINGKVKNLGSYLTPEEASNAYQKALLEITQNSPALYLKTILSNERYIINHGKYTN